MSLQSYSKSDRRALLLLSVVAVALAVGVWLTTNRNNPDTRGDTSLQNQERYTSYARDSLSILEEKKGITLHAFDPNTIDSATLVSFGLRPNQAKAFINYRRAGAVFRQPLDIAHVYTLDDNDIDRLLPYVNISPLYKNRRVKYPLGARYDNIKEPTSPKEEEPRHPHYISDKFTVLTKVDLNTADTTLLKRIPGIGHNIAQWIVSHRERLGGFHSVNQLLEVRYVTPDMLEWFEIQTDSIQHIDLNTMSFNQMARHPYIGYNRAKAIENRKRLYGPFSDVESVLAFHIFPADTLELLRPYLKF